MNRSSSILRSLMPKSMGLFCLCALIGMSSHALAQVTESDETTSDTLQASEETVAVPSMVELPWLLGFEQAYGVFGLYITEPEQPDYQPAQVRKDLIFLTKLGRQFRAENPGKVPTLADLFSYGYLENIPTLPDGVEYIYLEDQERFVSNLGEEYGIVYGAMQQLAGAEAYRRRVEQGSNDADERLEQLARMDGAPELIKREVETRLFYRRFMEHDQIALMEDVQTLLAQLQRAITTGVESSYWGPEDPLTMELIGRTGLIDMLEALPKGGEYLVTTADKPPVAIYGEREIPADPSVLNSLVRRNITSYLKQYPDYPPALALQSKYLSPEEGFATITRAIELWPDVPALRVQRFAFNAQIMNTAAFQEDLDYLLARFPSTPILLELSGALSRIKNPLMHDWYVAFLTRSQQLRPEVLNFHLAALKVAKESGQYDAADQILAILVKENPGYEPLLRVNRPAPQNED